jgi:hypothetical protein
MNAHQSWAGINLTSNKLQFAEIEWVNNVLQIINADQTFVSPPFNFNSADENLIQQQIQTTFEELKIRNPININIVSFTLPTELFITLQLPYDQNLNQAEVREEISWEISLLYPFLNVDDLALKFYEMESSLFPTKRNALVIALNKKFLVLIKNFCTKNNLSAKLVDSASITANSFINFFCSENKPITIHLFNEKNFITLFINISSKPAYVKVFQKHGADVAGNLIEEFSKVNIKRILTAPSKSAIISGEELENDFIEEIGRATELVFEKLNLFEVIKYKPTSQSGGLSNEQSSSFISALGIAARSGQN